MKNLIPLLLFAFAVLESCNPNPQCCVPTTPIFDDPCECAFNQMWAPDTSKRTWQGWPYDYSKCATWQTNDFKGSAHTITVDPTQHNCVSEFNFVYGNGYSEWFRFYPYHSATGALAATHSCTDTARFGMLDQYNFYVDQGYTLRPHPDTFLVISQEYDTTLNIMVAVDTSVWFK